MDGTADKPSREFGKLPPCAPWRERGPGSAGTADPRSAAGRIKRHRRSAMPICGLQPSSAVVSAVASLEQASYHSLPHPCESKLITLLLLSKSNPRCWASIWLWNNGRGHYLRTAFVLTWFKIKERQASVSALLRNLKSLCRKGFPFQQVVGMLDVSLEIRRKRTNLPMGELRLSGLIMIDKETFIYGYEHSEQGDFSLPCQPA